MKDSPLLGGNNLYDAAAYTPTFNPVHVPLKVFEFLHGGFEHWYTT
jgi:hypothetical protein